MSQPQKQTSKSKNKQFQFKQQSQIVKQSSISNQNILELISLKNKQKLTLEKKQTVGFKQTKQEKANLSQQQKTITKKKDKQIAESYYDDDQQEQDKEIILQQCQFNDYKQKYKLEHIKQQFYPSQSLSTQQQLEITKENKKINVQDQPQKIQQESSSEQQLFIITNEIGGMNDQSDEEVLINITNEIGGIEDSSEQQLLFNITNENGGMENYQEQSQQNMVILQQCYEDRHSKRLYPKAPLTKKPSILIQSNLIQQCYEDRHSKRLEEYSKFMKQEIQPYMSYKFDHDKPKLQIQNALRILLLKGTKQKIILEGVPLYFAGPYKNQLHQYMLQQKQESFSILYPVVQLKKQNQTKNILEKNKNAFNKWVFSIMQPTIYLQKQFQQNQNLNLFAEFDVIQSQYGNIQIGIVEETAMSQYFNSLSNFRIGLHLRNGQIFDNADILTNKNNYNGWRNPKKEYSPPIFKDLTVKVGLQKNKTLGIYTVMWTLNQGKQSEWSQTSIINQKIIKQGLNFYLGFFHQNDKILINKNLQKTGTIGKRIRQLTSSQQQKNDQHPVSKKSLKQEIQTHKRQDQSQQILSSKKQEKSYENYQQKIVLEQLNNYYDLLKEDNQTKLDKIYAKKEQEIIQHLIKCLVSKRQQFISVSQKFLDLRLSVLDGPNSKLKQYLKVDIKKAQVNKTDFSGEFLYPQISITKLQSKEATNKWIFYLLGSSINIEIIKNTGQILRTTFYIQKSQHSNIQMGIVGRRANADYFNSLSNKRLGFHLRNCQIYDKSQGQAFSKWRQPKSPNKPSFDKITNGIQIKLEISYTAIKGYEIKWTVDDWSQTSTINQKLISEGINFFVSLFRSNDTIIVNKATQKTA